MRWGFLFERGGGSNFEKSYGFKAQDFENQESQINADYDSVFEVVNIVTPRHIAITTNEK